MPTSMKDIARVAGVTESTVSRALANSPRVNADTSMRIRRIAREMGYVPSAIARGLATRRTSTLGVVVMEPFEAFTADMVNAINRTASDHGYSVILSVCGPDPEREMNAIRLLLEQRVDAIVVPDPLVADSSLPQLQQIGVPVILLNRGAYTFSVGTDNLDGARQAVEHLLELAHRRIAYIGGIRSPDENAQRQEGYLRAMSAWGVPTDPSLLVVGDGWPAGGKSCMEQLLALDERPTAVFCFNDLVASGALQAIHNAGLRVPQDISVVGFDDSSLASCLVPPLTTFAQPKETMARMALRMALDLLDGYDASARIILSGKLVVRESTARCSPSSRAG